MDRRRFLLTSVAGALAAPPATGAQQAAKMWRIGLLGPASTEHAEPFVGVFRQRMRERGWGEGENVTLDQRWAEARLDVVLEPTGRGGLWKSPSRGFAIAPEIKISTP
jgi:putative tryptophan/tyrosine transport system substrate-binding protein